MKDNLETFPQQSKFRNLAIHSEQAQLWLERIKKELQGMKFDPVPTPEAVGWNRMIEEILGEN